MRTARAYAFLANFLEAAVGKEGLQSLHGLRQEGLREQDLRTELHGMRDLFYGLYLISAEDIGMKPALAKDELVDQDRCYQLASDWLGKVYTDNDIAVDTRVAVPIYAGKYEDMNRKVTDLWVTLGVHVAKLDADYARPRTSSTLTLAGSTKRRAIRNGNRSQPVAWRQAHYLIAVNEFAEVELPALKPLSREELRLICDRAKPRKPSSSP